MPAEVDSTLTFACYVEQKFVPDHVEHKTRAGRTHYQAMLKHMLRPETVNCIFGNISKTRRTLKAIPDWPYLDGVRLCDVTTDQVRKTIFAASSHGYSAQTLKHIKNVIEAVISHAQEEGCFHGTNPALVVKLPPLKHNPRRALSARQVSQALELMQYPERQIALITVYTGLKLTEICELRWNDLNLSLSPRMLDGEKLSPLTLKVRRKRKRSDEDGGPGGSMTVDISGPLLPTLLDLKWQRADADPNDFVMVSASGGPIHPGHARSRGLKHIADTLGMSWFSWQDLRRVHKKFAVEFLLEPYSVWGREGLLPSSVLPFNAA